MILHMVLRVLEKRPPRHFTRRNMGYRVRKLVVLVGYCSWSSLCVAILFGDRLGQLGFSLDSAGAGVAVALQEVLVGIAGCFAIGLAKLYAVGDRIQVGEITVDVIDISPLRTTPMETGNWVRGK